MAWIACHQLVVLLPTLPTAAVCQPHHPGVPAVAADLAGGDPPALGPRRRGRCVRTVRGAAGGCPHSLAVLVGHVLSGPHYQVGGRLLPTAAGSCHVVSMRACHHAIPFVCIMNS